MNRIVWLASIAVSMSVCACGGAGGGPTGTTGQDLNGSKGADGGVEVGERGGEAHGGKDDADVDLDERDGEAQHGDRDGGHDLAERDGDVDDKDGEIEREDGDVDQEQGEHADGGEGHGGRGPH